MNMYDPDELTDDEYDEIMEEISKLDPEEYHIKSFFEEAVKNKLQEKWDDMPISKSYECRCERCMKCLCVSW